MTAETINAALEGWNPNTSEIGEESAAFRGSRIIGEILPLTLVLASTLPTHADRMGYTMLIGFSYGRRVGRWEEQQKTVDEMVRGMEP